MRSDRFVALIATGRRPFVPVDRLEQCGLTIIRSDATLTVASDPRIDKLSIGPRGTLLGTLFDRSAREPLGDFDEPRAKEIVDSDGRALFTRYWGGYVAMVVNAGVTHVVRDPSGHIPCYWFEHGGGVVVTSDPALCVDLALLVPDVDWVSVAGHLLWYERRSRHSALCGVSELVPGERLSVGEDGTTVTPLWQPWPFTRSDRAITEDAEAVELVGRAVRNCVGAWGSRYRRPLVSLSGGLDSSIIAASLARSEPACVTIATAEPAGDERGFARLVANRIGVPLAERFFEPDRVDIHRSAAARLPRPVSRLFAQEVDRHWREAVNDAGADAIFHGGGGDNVFCYLTSPAPLLDSLWVNGFGPDTRQALVDVASLTDSSVNAVARAAVRKALVDRGRHRWNYDRSGLSAKAIALGLRFRHHPWFEARPNGVLPGKQAHVAALVRIQNHIDAAEPTRVAPVVAPLLSQPIVETCLRVPSWMWCRGGLNRSVARRAFAASLPDAIIGRRGKGTPDAFDATLIQANRSAIAEMLRGGVLARRGLLDVDWLECALSRAGPITGTDYLRASMLVDVEAWLQSWAAMGATMSDPDDARA